MHGHVAEVAVNGEHRQVVGDAQLRQQGVDRADPHARAPAGAPEFGGSDVVGSIGGQERQCGKAFQDDVAVPRP